MRALRVALVSRVRRVFCACPEELASAASVKINTAAKVCVLTLKLDGDRNINLGLLRALALKTWHGLAERFSAGPVLIRTSAACSGGGNQTEGEGSNGTGQRVGRRFRQDCSGIRSGDCGDCGRSRSVFSL